MPESSKRSSPDPTDRPYSGTQFALVLVALFGLGSLAVLLLEIAEKQGAISGLGESVSRLVVCSILLSVLAYSARRLGRTVRRAVTLCIVCVSVELWFEVVEDLGFIRMYLGPTWKHGMEKSIVACWTCSAFYLLYTLIRELDLSNAALRGRDREMQQANRQLAETLDSLKQTQAQTIEQERLSALGRMASGVAHDLNNALTPVVTLSRDLQQRIDSHQEHLELINLGAEHSIHVVKQLQHFYRPASTQQHRIVDLSDVIQQAIALTRFQWSDAAEKQGVLIKVETQLEDDCRVYGNSTELIQLLTNLLLNAVESMVEGGCVSVSTRRIDGEIQVSVADEGCGMSDEQLEHCFEPFYSGKGTGSGLGLSVCYGIVRRHSATIEIERIPSGGLRFQIRVPACRPTVSAKTNVGIEHVSLRGKRILCIDDNEWVLRGTEVLFQPTGVQLCTAQNGSQGLELLAGSKFDLLVTDLGMKEMSGREVVTLAKSKHPDLPIAVVSGWCRDQVLVEFEDGGPQPDFVLEKPLNVKSIQECFAKLKT